MVYRPTVRYHSTFKKYVDELFCATHLDRNQIIRAALFAAAHSKEFQSILHSNKKKDVPLPRPIWALDQSELWREQNPQLKGGGEDVNDNRRKTSNKETRQQGEVPSRIRTTGGGIQIRIG
jgi:hypothetical protein